MVYGNLSTRRQHFKFEVAWLMEESCEVKVSWFWKEMAGIVLDRLRYVSVGLNNWYNQIRCEKKMTKTTLRNQLEQLSALFPSEVVLEELVYIHLSMNLEANKDELYWEQRARVN